MNLRRRAIMASKKARLPKEFQEVEYLESTGTQYIDSGVIADSSLTLDMQFSLTNISITIQNGAIYFTGEGEGYSRHHLQCYNTNIWYGFGLMFVPIMLAAADTNKHTLKVRTDKLVFDDKVIHKSIENFTTNVNYWLFGRNSSNMAIVYALMRLYSCKLYNNDTLVRDFIPCYRKSDSKPGLYDLANDVFYTNAGTGEFLVGANVN